MADLLDGGGGGGAAMDSTAAARRRRAVRRRLPVSSSAALARHRADRTASRRSALFAHYGAHAPRRAALALRARCGAEQDFIWDGATNADEQRAIAARACSRAEEFAEAQAKYEAAECFSKVYIETEGGEATVAAGFLAAIFGTSSLAQPAQPPEVAEIERIRSAVTARRAMATGSEAAAPPLLAEPPAAHATGAVEPSHASTPAESGAVPRDSAAPPRSPCGADGGTPLELTSHAGAAPPPAVLAVCDAYDAAAAAAAATQSFGTDGGPRPSLGAAGNEAPLAAIAPPQHASLGVAGVGIPIAGTALTGTAAPSAARASTDFDVLALMREFGRDGLAITIDESDAVFGERGRFALSSATRLQSPDGGPFSIAALVLLLQLKDKPHQQYLEQCIKFRSSMQHHFVKINDRASVLGYLLGGSEDSVAGRVLPLGGGGAPVVAVAADATPLCDVRSISSPAAPSDACEGGAVAAGGASSPTAQSNARGSPLVTDDCVAAVAAAEAFGATVLGDTRTSSAAASASAGSAAAAATAHAMKVAPAVSDAAELSDDADTDQSPHLVNPALAREGPLRAAHHRDENGQHQAGFYASSSSDPLLVELGGRILISDVEQRAAAGPYFNKGHTLSEVFGAIEVVSVSDSGDGIIICECLVASQHPGTRPYAVQLRVGRTSLRATCPCPGCQDSRVLGLQRLGTHSIAALLVLSAQNPQLEPCLGLLSGYESPGDEDDDEEEEEAPARIDGRKKGAVFAASDTTIVHEIPAPLQTFTITDAQFASIIVGRQWATQEDGEIPIRLRKVLHEHRQLLPRNCVPAFGVRFLSDGRKKRNTAAGLGLDWRYKLRCMYTNCSFQGS